MKKIIITLTLLLGVMSYGQDIAVVTEYTNSTGEMIFVHKNGGSTPPGRCQFGDLPRFALTGQYSVILLSGNRIGIDPDVRNGNTPDGVTYNIVSNADRDAFRNDILEDRQSPATAPNIYRTRNGGLSFDTPCGDSNITPDAYFRSQPDFTDFILEEFYQFRNLNDIYVVEGPHGFFIDFYGTGHTELRFSSITALYERLQELLELEAWERRLIALGFTEYTGPLTYDYEKTCSNGRIIRARRGDDPNQIVIFSTDLGIGYTVNNNDLSEITRIVNRECDR